VLDGGRTLGNSFFRYRQTYFYKAGFDWKIKQGARTSILNKIAPVTLRYEAAECSDLPELQIHRIDVDIHDDHRRVYKRLLDGLLVELKQGTLDPTCNSAEKLLQVCSGFLIGPQGVPEVLPGTNEKIEALQDVLQQTAKQGQKILVCHVYQQEGRLIEQLCRKMHLPFSSLRGEVKDKDTQYARYKDPNGTRVMIFHPKSAGEGLNLQFGHYLSFFSLGRVGIVMRQQIIGRILRTGQKNNCVVFDLVTRDTVEERLYDNLGTGIETSKILLDYIRGQKR